MKYYQVYTYNEDSTGQQSIYFSIANTYEELYETGGIEVDIFDLESVNQDLELDDGSFAIDELSFTINGGHCITQDQKDALSFVLDATDINTGRYCIVCFGTTPSPLGLLFVGKVQDKVTGEDKRWDVADYGYEIKAQRVWKFSALSFDLSILERCKFTEAIIAQDGSIIPNVYDRLSISNYAAIEPIFKHRLATATYDGDYLYYRPLGNLKKVIELYLNVSSDIIEDLIGTAIVFELEESDLGFSVSPPTIMLSNKIYYMVQEVKNSNVVYKAFMQDDDISEPDERTALLIHRRMIEPKLGYYGLDDAERELRFSEDIYSFKSLNNTSELIFEIARALGCFVTIKYQANNIIKIKFNNRKSIVKSNYTFIKNVESASIDTSSVISSRNNNYYSVANKYCAEGNDIVYNDNGKIYQSETRKTVDFTIKELKDKKNIDSKRLIFSLSTPLDVLAIPDGTSRRITLPFFLNMGYSGSLIEQYGGSYDSVTSMRARNFEKLHNGLYMKSRIFEDELVSRLPENTTITRTIAKILTARENEMLEFNTLADYINYVTINDLHYYKTEYSLEVPHWSGFALNSNGESPSWSNLVLGSKIKIREHFRKWELRVIAQSHSFQSLTLTIIKANHGLQSGDTVVIQGLGNLDGSKVITVVDNDTFTITYTGGPYPYNPDAIVKYYKANSWAEADVDIEYIVVGIERRLNEVKTSIKLHNSERFAYGAWSGNVSEFQVQGINYEGSLEEQNNPTVKQYLVKNGATVNAYDAVKVENISGLNYVTPSVSSYSGNATIGVALETVTGNGSNTVLVQVGGRVGFNSNVFDNSIIGKPLLARTKGLIDVTYLIPNSNLTSMSLETKNTNEDLFIVVGVIDSSSTFIINLWEAQYE